MQIMIGLVTFDSFSCSSFVVRPANFTPTVDAELTNWLMKVYRTGFEDIYLVKKGIFEGNQGRCWALSQIISLQSAIWFFSNHGKTK